MSGGGRGFGRGDHDDGKRRYRSATNGIVRWNGDGDDGDGDGGGRDRKAMWHLPGDDDGRLRGGRGWAHASGEPAGFKRQRTRWFGPGVWWRVPVWEGTGGHQRRRMNSQAGTVWGVCPVRGGPTTWESGASRAAGAGGVSPVAGLANSVQRQEPGGPAGQEI